MERLNNGANMEDKLKDIFENVNNWLKFAEAKNALIIVLNGTLIFRISGFYSHIQNNVIYFLYFMSILMLLISIVIAIISFIPRLKTPYIKMQNPLPNDNLLYFGHIAKYTPDQYYLKISKILSKDDKYKEFNMHYSNQIVVNSRITFIKFKQFEISVFFLISAFLTPLGTWFLYKNRQ